MNVVSHFSFDAFWFAILCCLTYLPIVVENEKNQTASSDVRWPPNRRGLPMTHNRSGKFAHNCCALKTQPCGEFGLCASVGRTKFGSKNLSTRRVKCDHHCLITFLICLYAIVVSTVGWTCARACSYFFIVLFHFAHAQSWRTLWPSQLAGRGAMISIGQVNSLLPHTHMHSKFGIGDDELPCGCE